MAVHLYGQPCQMDRIMNIAKKFNLLVIEDCAQALGATYKGQKVGSFGIAGCVSCYPGKNLGAYGDGGVILTNDDALNEKLRMLRNDGQPNKYVHSMVGWNERLDELQAAVLRIKLKYLPKWNQQRANIATLYKCMILEKKIQAICPAVSADVKHVYHQFVIQVNNRDRVRQVLWEKYNIGTGIHYPIPVHKQEAYKAYNDVECPYAEEYAPTLLSLPIFPELTYEEIKIVIDSLAKAIKEAKNA
jgi:dTDP-4-amino-4,6-dideoxygalactose transaminase